MSAERLRQAATLLRSRAEAATPGPWRALGRNVRSGRSTDAPMRAGQSVLSTAAAMPYTNCRWHAETPEDQREPDARYAATMSPPVALALAEWLDAEAYHDDRWQEAKRQVVTTMLAFEGSTLTEALAVADAILGGAV